MSKSENKAQEIKALIADLKAKRAEDLKAVEEKAAEAQKEKNSAAAEMKAAAEALDLKAYEIAKAAKEKAETELEMLSQRSAQIQAKEIVTEAESDKVINSLLAYEEELTAEFEKAISEPLRALEKLQRAYSQAIRETEAVIRLWTIDIHANHDTRGRTQYYDAFTETHTTRSAAPVPVHATPYEGSAAAQIIDKALIGKLAQFINQAPEE